jgi:hypothetical protein
MTGVLWFVGGPLTILWMLLPIYLMWRNEIAIGLLLLLINVVIGIIMLRWINSFYNVSYDDNYLYVTKFKTERKFELTDIKKITQGNFQKMNFEIETKGGDIFNFVSKYSLKLVFDDWPDNLKELKKRIGQ